MAYGEGSFAGQKMFRAENIWKAAFFALVWPVAGFLTLIATLATNSVLEKNRPLLSKYARFAAAVAVGMLVPEVLSLIAQPAMAKIIAIDIVLVGAFVAWMVLRYSSIAAILLALFEALGIVMALKAKMSVGGIGFFFVWALIAVVVVRLGVIGCVGMALKQGLKVERPEDVGEIFA